MMKKLLLTFVLALTCLTQAGAYPTFEKNGIYYDIQSGDSTVYVTNGTVKYTGNVSIPSHVNYNDKRYDVIGISGSAFNGNTELLSVSIPNSVTIIADGHSGYYRGAFRGCTSLTSITLPNSITYLGGCAFENCI